jgi:hypothetical protein
MDYVEGIQTFVYEARIYNKITTTTKQEVYIIPNADGSGPGKPIGPIKNFTGNTAYFLCDSDVFFNTANEDIITEEIKVETFKFEANIAFIMAKTSSTAIRNIANVDTEKSFTKMTYTINGDKTEEKETKLSESNFRDTEFIPSDFNETFTFWRLKNTVTFRLIPANNPETRIKTFTCKDDCDRPIKITIMIKSTSESKLETVTCNTCVPKNSPKKTWYAKTYSSSSHLQPKLVECKITNIVKPPYLRSNRL